MALNTDRYTGTTPPVVMLHGLGGTTRYWTSVFKFIEKNRAVTLIDLLGFGDSPKPLRPYTLDRHLAELSPILMQHKKCILVGHSMGAVIALAYAARFPEHVKKLVLISLPYFGNMATAKRWFQRKPGGWIYTNMLAMIITCIFTRRVAARILPLIYTTYPKIIIQDLVKHNVMSSITSLWNVLYKRDLISDCENIPTQIQVACIHSENADLAPFEHVENLTKLYHWTLHRSLNNGHHPWLNHPEQCWKIITYDPA